MKEHIDHKQLFAKKGIALHKYSSSLSVLVKNYIELPDFVGWKLRTFKFGTTNFQ